METLILSVTSRLFALRHHPSFPDPELAPEKDALNCIRVLTRIFPFIYEKDSLNDWEDRFFWATRRRRTKDRVIFDKEEEQRQDKQADEFEDAPPLAEELMDTLVDLLFYSGFTIPRNLSKSKVYYAIWQSGVGSKSPAGTSKELEDNRIEILRCLLSLCSKAMYMTASKCKLSNWPG